LLKYISSKTVKKRSFLTPILDKFSSSEAKKMDRELLVGGFGGHIMLITLPKPYLISTWISDAAERRRKKIEKIDLGKKVKKIDFFKLQKSIDHSKPERSGTLI
jgi:hypothetical protein